MKDKTKNYLNYLQQVLCIVLLSFICFSLQAQGISQEKKIKGTVLDEQGMPVIGASILIDGTKKGTISDVNGQFILTVPTSAKLTVSFIGYDSKKLSIGDKNTFSIVLTQNTKMLDEMVVIGYGSRKKSDLTSSVSKITNDNIKDRPLATLSEAFEGQLAGVRAQNSTGIPGAELNIKIRGISTINGNSNPLYVIDGVPRDNMTNLSPNDIASIQVLKDASATSIYGSRGACGVILIETKKGSGKPTISLDAYYGIQDPVKMMDMMNGNQWVAYETYVRNETYLRQGGKMEDPMSSRPSNLQIPTSWTDGSRPGVDWQKAITRTAPIQSYQLSSSSSNDKGSLYISGGYLNQDGIIKETYFNRLNFRVNATSNVTDKLKIGLNLSPTYSKQADQNTQGKETVIHHALTQIPIIQLNEATQQLGFPSGFPNVYTNPLEELKQMTDFTEKAACLSTIWAQYTIIPGLNLKSQASYDYTNSSFQYFYPAIALNGIPSGNTEVQKWLDSSIQNTLNYTFSVAKDNKFDLLLGQSAESHKYYDVRAAASGFPNSIITTLNVASTPTQAYSALSKYTKASFFGRLNYTYKDKYILNASYRIDGSSRFGRNNEWGGFPSVSAGWKLSEEPFLKDVKWITLLKTRIAYGKAGNDNIGNYAYIGLMSVNNTAWNNTIQSGLAQSNIANNDLKWEATSTNDLGLDVSLFKNRIQLNFDYYYNKTSNLLFNAPIPYSTGFGSITTNLGSVANKGWEVDLTTRNIDGKFGWSTSLNLSSNRNKVLSMGNVNQIISGNWDAQFITKVGGPVCQDYVYRTDGLLMPSDFTNGKANVPIMTGQVVGNVKYKDLSGPNGVPDGVINSYDLAPYGHPLPDLTYGLTNKFNYKNFELSILIRGQIGGNVCWLGQRQIDAGTITTNTEARWLHSWKPDYVSIYGAGQNPIPSIAGIDMSWDGKTPYILAGKNDNNSDLRIYDATMLAIKNVTLTYNVPTIALKKTPLTGAKFYISIDNIAMFDNYPGITPEANSYGNDTTQSGVDYTTYPLSRKYTLGVNLTF